ncbi:MAG: hypothetical protein ACI857_002196 [Arenicella sp.]|jgi:hypothetical protein
MKYLFLLPLGFILACNSPEVEEVQEAPIQEAEEYVEDDVYELLWNFEDEFTDIQKDTLKLWITDVQIAVYYTLGDYPFDINIFFHSSDSKGERPVSFAHTTRKKIREIHFYVKPDATYAALMEDWTAQHEMSHLSAPFFGKPHKWISEGYATYLSRRIMIDMGYFTEEEFEEMYTTKIAATKEFYYDEVKPFSEVSADLFESYNYGTVYWGSAGYWYTADKKLQESHDMRLENLVKRYQSSGRLDDKNLEHVIKSFDEFTEDTIFRDLLDSYQNDPCCDVMKAF